MMKSGKTESTQRGYLNESNQLNYGYNFSVVHSDVSTQRVYTLECQFCNQKYGVKSNEIALKQCPVCQDGETKVDVAA